MAIKCLYAYKVAIACPDICRNKILVKSQLKNLKKNEYAKFHEREILPLCKPGLLTEKL